MPEQTSTPKRTRTRKAKPAAHPLRAAYDAASTPAACARVLGVDGKAFRTALRKAGVHVSKDRSAFNASVRAAFFDKYAPQQ